MADCVFTNVLCDLQHEGLALVFGVKRVQDLWQIILELNVNDGADDLGDFADCICHVVSPVCLQRFRAGNDFDQLVRNDGLAGA